MNPIALAEPRVVRFRTSEFHGFRVCDNGRTYELGRLDADSLEDALTAALTGRQVLNHKEHVCIRETGQDGVKLHLFAVKRRSAPRYVHKNHVTRAVHDLYAAPVCSFDGGIVG